MFLCVDGPKARINAVTTNILHAGGSAKPFQIDATNGSEVTRSLTARSGRVFNVGANKPIKFLDLAADEFERFWRVGCYAAFLVAQEAVRRMLPSNQGTIIFTGASASLRANLIMLTSPRRKRGCASSLKASPENGPRGLHIAHVVIDGGIKSRSNL
jgi:NAD(P)-dependent dehydrogenase (short-subunit alcohol dehydrogenase family)